MTFGLSDTVTALQGMCSAPGLQGDANTCPINEIIRTCTGLSNPSGDVVSLCATPCVQMVAARFDACAQSTEARVVAVFDASNWQPLVQVCTGDQPAGAGGAAATASQCENIEEIMMGALSSLCCSDAQCGTTPTSCSTQCKDALLAFFRDCAAELLLADPGLMERLTPLAELCTSDRPASAGAQCRLEYVADKPLSWVDAEAECVSRGGHLASIHSANQQSQLVALVPDGGAAWIGLVRTATLVSSLLS